MTIAQALGLHGMLGLFTKEWDQSHRSVEEALTHWEDAGDAWGIAHALLYLGAIEFRQGHSQEAVRLMKESLARQREIGDESATGLVLMSPAPSTSWGVTPGLP